MLYFETSAKEGVAVNEAFVEMVKMGIKRESNNSAIMMPDSIGGGGGGIKLSANRGGSNSRGGTTVTQSKCCWLIINTPTNMPQHWSNRFFQSILKKIK